MVSRTLSLPYPSQRTSLDTEILFCWGWNIHARMHSDMRSIGRNRDEWEVKGLLGDGNGRLGKSKVFIGKLGVFWELKSFVEVKSSLGKAFFGNQEMAECWKLKADLLDFNTDLLDLPTSAILKLGPQSSKHMHKHSMPRSAQSSLGTVCFVGGLEE